MVGVSNGVAVDTVMPVSVAVAATVGVVVGDGMTACVGIGVRTVV